MNESSLIISELPCEYLVNPLGIDDSMPRFSCQFSSLDNNRMQSAYRILVSMNEESLDEPDGEIWDSGMTRSRQSSNVSFEGMLLKSFQKYFWKVKVWDEKNNATAWSHIGYFETAMLNKDDWTTGWLGNGRSAPERYEDFNDEIPAPLFKKMFKVPARIKTVRLYVSGLGYYEAYINGEKAEDHVLDPGWANYGKELPPNITTRLFIPAKDPQLVMVNGIPAMSNTDLEFIEFDGSYVIFKTGNGSFDISTEL
jgi:alpha-L-rhamnosidase